jgi:uncharacterized protein YcfL
MNKTLPLIAAAALLLGGCYGINTVQNTDTTAQVRPVPDRRVIWDETLAGKLQVGTIIETTVGGLRKIQVPVSNNYLYHQEFVYQFVWSDANGMTIDTGNSWHRLYLEANETSTISEVAPTPAAHDFVIKFQETKFHQGVF